MVKNRLAIGNPPSAEGIADDFGIEFIFRLPLGGEGKGDGVMPGKRFGYHDQGKGAVGEGIEIVKQPLLGDGLAGMFLQERLSVTARSLSRTGLPVSRRSPLAMRTVTAVPFPAREPYWSEDSRRRFWDVFAWIRLWWM